MNKLSSFDLFSLISPYRSCSVEKENHDLEKRTERFERVYAVFARKTVNKIYYGWNWVDECGKFRGTLGGTRDQFIIDVLYTHYPSRDWRTRCHVYMSE